MFKSYRIIGMGQSTLNQFKRLERSSPLFKCNITTNQQNQFKESEKHLPKKRKITFSNVHMKVAAEILGVEIDYLLQKQQLGPENVIQLIEPPNELYKDVYERLKVILRTHSYPHGLSSESNKTTYVDTLLFTIVDHVNRDLETENPKILLVKEYDIKMVYDGDVLLGRLDYAIVQLSSRKEQACLLIVECKKENVDVAVKQCLLALKHIYSGRPVYGCCTTAEDWNFIMFNGEDFKIIHKRNVIFPRMDEHEDLWIKNCTLVIQIIYSCLIEQLRQFTN